MSNNITKIYNIKSLVTNWNVKIKFFRNFFEQIGLIINYDKLAPVLRSTLSIGDSL